MAKRRHIGKPFKEALVVELGADGLKIVQVSSARKGISLDRVHVQRLNEGQSAAEAIANARTKHKFSAHHIIGVLPRQSVNVRLMELPSTDGSEIADMVDLQSGRQTPYSRDEILSDYRLLGQTRRGTYTRVMLAIVQRGVIRERFHDLERGGMDVERMSVATEGLLAWTQQLGLSSSGAVAVLDVDASSSELIVVQLDSLVSTKQILLGADLLRADVDGNGAKLASEVQQALDAIAEGAAGVQVSTLVLTGAVAAIDGLEASLSRELTLDLQVRGPALANVEDKKSFCAVAAEAGMSVTALIGMALAPDALELNLFPEIVNMRRELIVRSRVLSALGIALMALLVTGSLWLSLATSFKTSRLEKLQALVVETQPTVSRVEKMVEVLREVRNRRDPSRSPANLMPELHKCVPEGVLFEKVEYDVPKRSLSLAGTAPSRKELRNLIADLEESPMFSGVEESGRNAIGKDGRFVFQVTLALEGGE